MEDTNINLPPEKILEKLKKLMTLRDRTDNPQEAANASARVLDLLTKYNLDEAQISMKEKPKIIEVQIDLNDYQSRHDAGYAKNLWVLLSAAYYCQAIFLDYNRKQYDQGKMAFIGREVNVQTLIYTGQSLLNRLTPMEQKQFKADSQGLLRNAHRRAYMRGAVSGIHAKLMEQKREQERAVDTGEQTMALVTTTKAEIKEFVDDKYGQLQRGVNRQKSLAGEGTAQRSGFHAGYGMEINKGISGGNPITKGILR